MVQIPDRLRRAVRDHAGPGHQNEEDNYAQMQEMKLTLKISAASHHLPGRQKSQVIGAVEAALNLKLQFDNYTASNRRPISRPELKGIASGRGDRLAEQRANFLSAVSCLREPDRKVISGYRQACFEAFLGDLSDYSSHLRDIVSSNKSSLYGDEIAQANTVISQLDGLTNELIRKKNRVSNGIDKGASSFAEDLNAALDESFNLNDMDSIRRCLDFLVPCLGDKRSVAIRNACAPYDCIRMAVRINNICAGYSSTVMTNQEKTKIDQDQDTYLGKPILIALDGPKERTFKFEKNSTAAQKASWFKDWSITEMSRGERRAFFAIKNDNSVVVLLKYYAVHPDEEGGYDYEKDLLKAMNNITP